MNFFLKISSLFLLSLFTSCDNSDEEEQTEDTCPEISIRTSTNLDGTRTFVANGHSETTTANYVWFIDDVLIEGNFFDGDNTEFFEGYNFPKNGTYNLCVFIETPECPLGVEYCEEIVVDNIPEIADECPEISIRTSANLDGTRTFVANGHSESTTANYVWFIDGVLIESDFLDGDNTQFFEGYNFPEKGTYDLCIFIETPDCPQGVEYCQEIVVDNLSEIANECPEISFRKVLQNNVLSFTASSITELDSRYVWYVNGEFINSLETSDNYSFEGNSDEKLTYHFPENGLYDLCLFVETPDCPQGIEYCEQINVRSVDDGTITVFDITVSNPVQDKSLETCVDLTYDYTNNGDNVFTLAVNNAEEIGGNFSWSINGDFFESGAIINYEFVDNGNYTICVSQETPECPNAVSFCRDFNVDLRTAN